MPLYEYECQDCGVRFERHQRITDDAIKTCPECGGEVRRVIHPARVVFKGKGLRSGLSRKGNPNDVRRLPECVETRGVSVRTDEGET